MHATSREGSRKGENLVYILTYHCASWCQGKLDAHITLISARVWSRKLPSTLPDPPGQACGW